MLGSDLRPRVNRQGPKSAGAVSFEYDGVFAVRKKIAYKRFSKFLGRESQDASGLYAGNEEYFYERRNLKSAGRGHEQTAY